MKTSISRFFCVLVLVVSLIIPSSVFAYTQADIDGMFATVQSLLAQVTALLANRGVAEVSTGACSIQSFVAYPGTTVSSGTAVVLAWSATSSCTGGKIFGGQFAETPINLSGEKKTNPLTTTTTYKISFGTVSKTLTITVGSETSTPAPTVTLSASPTSITSGQSATLTWSTTNATSCTASNGWTGSKATSGTQSVSPTANTTYTLSCTGAGGSASQSATVVFTTTTPAPTVTLSASPTSITSGQSATLTWSTTNATSCTASNGWTGSKATSGTQSVSPTANTTYTLSCTGAGGSASQSATVVFTTTTPAPTVTLSASPTSITSGQSATLTWSTTNATSCTASNGWTGSKATSGTQSVSPTVNTTYDLTCSGTGGSASQSATVVFTTTTPAPTVTLSASPTSITSGQSATLTWSSTNATSCTASNGWTGSKATSGTQSVSPTVNTTYDLTCSGTGGSASQSETVSVGGVVVKPIPGNGVSLTPTKLLPAYGPLLKSASPIAEVSRLDSNFLKYEQKHYNDYIAITSGVPAVGYNHYGFLGSRLAYAIRNGLPYGAGVTNEATDMYARGRRVALDWLATYSLPNNYAVAQWQDTSLEDLEALVVLENNPNARMQIHMDAARGTANSPYMTMQAANADPRGITIFLQPMLIAHRLGIPYVHPGNGYQGSFDKTHGSWINAAKRNIYWLDQYDVIKADGSIPSNSHGGAEAYFMSAMLINQLIGYYGYVDRDPKVFSMIQRSVDHWINVLPAGWDTLPYQSKNTSTGSSSSPAPDLAGFYVYPSLVMWQETGNQKYYDFAIKNLKAANTSYVAGHKQFNQVFNTDTFASDALLSGVHWKPANPPYPPTGSYTPPPVTTPAPTVTLSASPTSITSGQSATLTWSSTNATSCTASNGWTGSKTTSGTQSVSPTANTTYTLSCTGTGGSASQSVTVSTGSVTTPPPTQKLMVGDYIQTTSNLNVRSVAGGTLLGTQSLGAQGKVVAGPVVGGDANWWNVDYANSPDGWSIEPYLTKVTTTPAPTVTLSASPTSITSGQSATLTWSTTNATSCTASNGWTGSKATSGTQSVSPTANTTYTLSCTGAGGSASQSVTVSVGGVVVPPPTNGKFLIGDTVQTTSNLNVRSTPNGAKIGQQILGAQGKVVSGPVSVVSTNETTVWWNIDYTNAPDGWSIEPYLTKVTTTPAPTVTLSASPTSITSGQSATLTWSSTNATSCTASNGWTGSKTTSGTQSVSPTANTTYTLSCTGTGGSASQSVTVSVGNNSNLPVVTISASPSTITSGQSATLTWSSTNATSCTASNGWTGSKTTSGTQSVSPTLTTKYALTCTGAGGSTTQSATVSINAVSGPIVLPAQPLIFQVPMPTQTGKLWTIAPGDSAGFQQALNQAQLGDTIELAAGSTYTGNFTFPKKTSGNGWIIVRTNKYSSLPSSGVRVGPADAVNMAKIVSSNTGSTISFPSGSHHYRLIGLDVTNAISNTSYVQTAMISIFSNTSNAADIPNNITLDRMYIHSQPTTAVQRCVHADGSYVAVVDSYLGECHAKGYDSQAIAAWNTNGPLKIVNNMLEGAGENVMFGGADPVVQGANPSDIEIRNNYFYTPVAWKGTLNSGSGTSLWTKKNLLEFKTGKRVLVEGNVFDGSWGDAQVGHAFVIKSSNQGGKCTWCQTADITIRYNVVKNIGGTGGVSGTSGSNNNQLGGLTSRVLFEHNLFQNINVSPYTGVARLIELYNNAPDVTYRNNTWDNMGGYIQHFISGGSAPTATNFTYVDNIAPFGQYGLVPGFSEATFAAAIAGNYNYSGNVVYGSVNNPVAKYPNTKLVADYNTALSVGKGANIPAVLAATKNAISGNGMGTTPPPVALGSVPVYAVANNPAVLGQSTTGLMFARTLVKGMQGGDVMSLQELLSKLGFFDEEATGYFGAVTEQAVQKFQMQYGIVSSGNPGTTGYGIVGPKTQQKIIEISQ